MSLLRFVAGVISLVRAAIAVSLWLVGLAAPLSAAAQTADFKPKARQAILMDAASGAILYQHQADELTPPASMSKLMTLAVLFKALKSEQLRGSDEFLMSERAWRQGGAPSGTSAMMVPVNTKVRLDELVQGIIIQSGNDACIAVAEGMAGSEDAFARLMEAHARTLGLTKSTFRNATGLYHPEHLMSARELAILARHLITTYPDYYAIFGQKEFLYRKHKFINRNPLLFLDINADGLKTGFIKEAGYGLVGSALQDGRRLIVVVGGLATANDRKDEAKRLLEWGFKSFTEFKVFDAGEDVGQARVWGGERMYVRLTGQGDLAVILPRFPANQRLKGEIIYKAPLKAPVRKGDQVAKLRVTSTSGAVNELPLFAAESIETGGVMRRGLDSLVHLAFRWVPL